MANLLVIEAASDSCSIALQIDKEITQRLEDAPRMHSRLLYPMLNDLMDTAGIKPIQLDAVVFGHGPGSFTGLRIAAATAQGIGFACDIPLIGVSTLQAMAQQGFAQHQSKQVLSLMDARMNELYVGQYALDDQQIMQAQAQDQIAPFNASINELNLKITAKDNACVGHGLLLADKLDPSITQWAAINDASQILQAQYLLPMANQLLQSGQVLAPENVELAYLREQSHWKTIKQQKEMKKS